MANGLYIHIPFCTSKCPYCDFFSGRGTPNDAKSYGETVLRLMQDYPRLTFDTVYFGGGTPSCMDAGILENILNGAKRQFSILPQSEITVECNPASPLQTLAPRYAEMGVNRISLGLQSAVDAERRALGRLAGAKAIETGVRLFQKAGIENISVDLMLGIPQQTPKSLQTSLEFIDSLGVCHVSAYMLKIEPGTKFDELQKQGKLTLPQEDTVCDMYLQTVEFLEAHGLAQYEISNFARPGRESRHNLKYWTLEDYLGLGPTAHSLLHGRRFYYDEEMRLCDEGPGGGEDERLMLGLRLKQGVPREWIPADISLYLKNGFMAENGKNVHFTPKGMLISNAILAEWIG